MFSEKRKQGDEVVTEIARDPEVQTIVIRKAMADSAFSEKLRE